MTPQEPKESWEKYRNTYVFDEHLTVVRAEAIDKFSGDYYVGKPLNIGVLINQAISTALAQRDEELRKRVRSVAEDWYETDAVVAYGMRDDFLDLLNNK